MAVKKITRRWLLNSFAVIVFIIVLMEIVFAVGITNYYYNFVRQTLVTRADSANAAFKQYSEDTRADFPSLVRGYVATFSQRESMELMTIDINGGISLTSSGFLPEGDDRLMPDYDRAMAESTGRFVGQLNGQRVMAVSVMSPVTGQESLSAVRLVVGLQNVDRQIHLLIAGMVLLGLFVLSFVLFSSSYFISSIVNPIGEVGETARKIASGDFTARLEKRDDDEIGELSDIINYMAAELGVAEQLKNDFISGVSHELRTPLTAIQGWGETLLSDDGEDKEMLHKGMSVIINETVRLSNMVEELLDFSKMQSGRLKLVLGKMDALAELSEAVLMYTERARREHILLAYDESDGIATVYGDKNKLRQAFVNVIDNAIKYSDSGGEVKIETILTPQSFTVRVEDFGIGIREEELPQIKQKFYKADSTRRGSGIGLALADEIITRHGGMLEIGSKYGEGTTVTITLPVYTKQDEAVSLQE
ncbi:MAG: HAMP domain-containing histidine kinase [Oscillospiraceae bacterium]|nr:HAMP domain-containing histidine kinase [Oscillospiraceae bacterium]